VALSTASWQGPQGSSNVLSQSARVTSVSVTGVRARLDFTAPEGDWGLPDRNALRAFGEQVVYTATDEKSVSEVKLTQNDGQDAVIATAGAIVTYQAPLTREIVAPNARRDHTVAYYARDEGAPVAIFLEGAGVGATPEARITSRLVALESGATHAGDAFNVVAPMRARLQSVTISGDLVTIDHRAPDDDRGVNGSASLRALVQQLVFTASEEPGIVRVLITQNGGLRAVIGGEGLIVDRPQTRRGLLED
jgi:Sporulation and spore germination